MNDELQELADVPYKYPVDKLEKWARIMAQYQEEGNMHYMGKKFKVVAIRQFAPAVVPTNGLERHRARSAVRPAIITDYFDDNGRLHRKEFGMEYLPEFEEFLK